MQIHTDESVTKEANDCCKVLNMVMRGINSVWLLRQMIYWIYSIQWLSANLSAQWKQFTVWLYLSNVYANTINHTGGVYYSRPTSNG